MNDTRSSDAAGTTVAADVFQHVWGTLVGVLGTAVAATLLRRAAANAARRRPDLRELEGFRVTRSGMDYSVVLPPSWSEPCDRCLEAARYLIKEELYPLLEELTGSVVIRLLDQHPALAPGTPEPASQAQGDRGGGE